MTNDEDLKAAIERVRWVVVRAVNGWHDQPQAEYEDAVAALDLITTTLSDTEADYQAAREESNRVTKLLAEAALKTERYRRVAQLYYDATYEGWTEDERPEFDEFVDALFHSEATI